MKRELIANGFRDFFRTEASAININIRGRWLPLDVFNQSIGSIITNKDLTDDFTQNITNKNLTDDFTQNLTNDFTENIICLLPW